MTYRSTPPRRLIPWPGDGGPLLAAVWASLTSPGPDAAGLVSEAQTVAISGPPSPGQGIRRPGGVALSGIAHLPPKR